MGRKKHQAPGLGKALIKDRFGKSKTSGHLHAAELAAENIDTEVNLKSVTELNSLDEFLATAQLAGTEFTAKRLNVHFVDANQKGILSENEEKEILATQDEFKHLLQIPRRPKWDLKMSKDELDKNERESFLDWRRKLAVLQEEEQLLVTPYEKNLDFWRQLWRVIERSDVVVQIVDARDPLLFRCTDLETYVKEVDPQKQNLILVNKADLLSSQQREAWKNYFQQLNVAAVFWSAVLESEKLEDNEEIEQIDNDESLLSREQLIQYFKDLVSKDKKVIGMVGYPNVGKSSTVNTLMGVKRVAVSATPGRTKHFQTLHVDEELCLCDCPGLVFPSFLSSKAEMVLSGILPIDQMRDHISPMNLLSRRIPRKVIEVTYGTNIPRPPEGDDPNRAPTSSEILNAHALLRGFMTSHGQPDNARSARIILKDYVNGKLLCSRAPPGVDEALYRDWTVSKVDIVLKKLAAKVAVAADMKAVVERIDRLNKHKGEQASEIEAEFFKPEQVKTFSKGRKSSDDDKSSKKHFNKKKEKMRRVRTVQY
uniref:Large subunit GTPase 1 homolog n=1 Tax=Phallusia mammillata TaxID=59560 RepID=A0A6F9DJC7_9ASCI|nr:large subunit GTPase 1 homolog [Phallusia mammillata]